MMDWQLNRESWEDGLCPWENDEDYSLQRCRKQKVTQKVGSRSQQRPPKQRYLSQRDNYPKKTTYCKVNTNISFNENLPKLNMNQHFVQKKSIPFWCQSNGFQTVRHPQRKLVLFRNQKQKTQQDSPKCSSEVDVEEQINKLEQMIRRYKKIQEKQHDQNTPKRNFKFTIKI